MVSTSELIEVRLINPKSQKALQIEIDDTHNGEGRIWSPTPGTLPYEDLVTRDEDGQPVFTGHLYTVSPYGRRLFEVHNLETRAVVAAAPYTRVDLIDIS